MTINVQETILQGRDWHNNIRGKCRSGTVIWLDAKTPEWRLEVTERRYCPDGKNLRHLLRQTNVKVLLPQDLLTSIPQWLRFHWSKEYPYPLSLSRQKVCASGRKHWTKTFISSPTEGNYCQSNKAYFKAVLPMVPYNSHWFLITAYITHLFSHFPTCSMLQQSSNVWILWSTYVDSGWGTFQDLSILHRSCHMSYDSISW